LVIFVIFYPGEKPVIHKSGIAPGMGYYINVIVLMVNNISGVILAGGQNKRFKGISKTKMVIGGKTIIARITDIISNIFSDIIIVSNTPGELVDYSNYIIVGDSILNKGPLGGIHAALKASDKEAVFIFAGDMPLLERDIILQQIEFFANNKCDILVPAKGRFIEPLHAIYSISVLDAIEKYLIINNDSAVREFYKMVHTSYMQFEDTGTARNAFVNVNTPADIRMVEKIINPT
jgi:molybdenum cofactor guanylyltransferase